MQVSVFLLKVPQRDNVELQSFEVQALLQYAVKPGVLYIFLKNALERGVMRANVGKMYGI